MQEDSPSGAGPSEHLEVIEEKEEDGANWNQACPWT